MALLPRLVLVEGLPGSGKTTTAERMCRRLRSRGVDANWAREGATPHPVFRGGLTERRRDPDFPEQCLLAWREFVSEPDSQTWVLDGAALHATVRYMYEERRSVQEIRDYWRVFEAIVVPLRPVIQYLHDDDPADRFRLITIPVRGRKWYSEAADAVARTPAGREFRHRGVEGFIEYWVRYGELCDELLAGSRLTVQTAAGALAAH